MAFISILFMFFIVETAGKYNLSTEVLSMTIKSVSFINLVYYMYHIWEKREKYKKGNEGY